MDTGALKAFAKEARRTLRDQVAARLALVRDDAHPARREDPAAFAQLEREIARSSEDQVIEKVAYTWFNRFCALRFMDANGHGSVRAVSPADAQTRPELLAEAMSGTISAEIASDIATRVSALLEGRKPSRDPQGEAYRLLLVATCNHWHTAMPFLFETIADYTELLMPEDLLSPDGILARMRSVMSEEACHDVEIIGWLYQFYISEKKDEVFAGLKKNLKIIPENIPAATQLFTPHWIVRYLVENSLGRLWLLNRPGSKLTAQMDYYIAPQTPETNFLRIDRPEDIRICDPACGSGHMLTYAFDLLHAIYEEEGHDAADIPSLILRHNLYGIEIDDRAGALAAFALVMKAAQRRRRFLRRPVQPNICVLENVAFRPDELALYSAAVGPDLFTSDLREMLGQFADTKNLGSLIRPVMAEAVVLDAITALEFPGDLVLRDIQARVLAVLRMAQALNPQYHVVVANPPYMGGKGMNNRLSEWAKSSYPDSKSDLYAMFIERCQLLIREQGLIAMVTIQNWMFLSSYNQLRRNMLTSLEIRSLVQIGYNSFPELNSKVVQAVAFIIGNKLTASKGQFINLNDAPQAANKEKLFLAKIKIRDVYYVAASDLLKIPGQPIAYWLTDKFRSAFVSGVPLQDYAIPRQGFATGNNDRFLRSWFEVSFCNFKNDSIDAEDARRSLKRWFPCNKGGEYRKWYGNNEIIADWKNDGASMRSFSGSVIRNPQYYFREGITWSTLTSSSLSMRYSPPGHVFETKGSMCFASEGNSLHFALALMNTRVVEKALLAISPTLDFHEGPIGRVPVIEVAVPKVCQNAKLAVSVARADWDAQETSWDFTTSPLLAPEHRKGTLSESYESLRMYWHHATAELRRIEEENNRIFIDAYGLTDEIDPRVDVSEITINGNPANRYSKGKTSVELEASLLADTMREFISYSVGCMFGRYSLDVPGLIVASQGEGVDTYAARVPAALFAPDADNVIPVLDSEWFADDIAQRFRRFLRIVFGDEGFHDNLSFVESAVGKDIRSYFMSDFYNDHVRRYRKRPIYWLFSSPKGSFNALIYLHRYRADTVSVVLNDYLREFRAKLETHRATLESLSINPDESPSRRATALKEIDVAVRQIAELDDWERDIMFPLASQRIEIDLDDGVKANYPKFGAALKPIAGLEAAEA